MFKIVILIAVLITLFATLFWLARHLQAEQHAQRARFIAEYRFPAALVRKYSEEHPNLGLLEVRKVFEGLRQYFLACLLAQRGAIAPSVGMPSKAVDDAWHDFILVTRDYQAFCRQAFGSYLHHTPDGMMGVPMRDALANTLHHMSKPLPGAAAWATVGAVPLLFAMDRELGVPDGHLHDAESLASLETARYSLERQGRGIAAGGGCGGSFGAGSGSGGCCAGASSGACCGGGGGCGGFFGGGSSGSGGCCSGASGGGCCSGGCGGGGCGS